MALWACAEAPTPPPPATPPQRGASGPNPNLAVDAAPGLPDGWVSPRVAPPATPFVVGAAVAGVAASWPIEPSPTAPNAYVLGPSGVDADRLVGLVTTDGDVVARIELSFGFDGCERRRSDLVRAFGEPSSTRDMPTARVDRWLGEQYAVQMAEGGDHCSVEVRLR
jgi:hypothetical protein